MTRAWTALALCLSVTCSLALGNESLSPQERSERVAKAEAEAKAAFAKEHYYFLTPNGRVDPAEGGIPAFAVGVRHWDAFRGERYIKEKRLLEMLGRREEAKKARWRHIGWGAVTVAASALVASAAAPLNVWEQVERPTLLRALGVFGGFGVAILGQVQFQRKLFTLDELFLSVQKLNDQIRANLRAQYRLVHGVPLEEPARPLPPDAGGKP